MRATLLVLLPVLCFASLSHSTEPCTDSVFADVVEDTVDVFHNGAFYNCCAVIDFDFEIGDTTIDIVETEIFPQGPCYCMCCFDLRVSISGVPAGVYWIQVWNEDKTVLYGRVRVIVGAVPSGPAGVSGFWQSDCLTLAPGGEGDVPAPRFFLGDLIPNPTAGEVRLSYQLERRESVSIEIYDSSGRALAEVAHGGQPAGRHSLLWNGERLPSGVYFVRLSAGESAAVRKLVIAR
jgi:hypothetical protein